MCQFYSDAKFLVQMVGQVFGTIYRAVLSACTSEGEHQVGESAFEVALHMGIGQFIYAFEEGEYFSVFFQKVYF